MPGLTEIRDAAVDCLRAHLPAPVKVTAFSGELTPRSAKGQGLTQAAIFVTALQARNAADPGSLAFDMDGAFGLFVLSRGGRGLEAREKDGLRLLESAALALHGADFGLPGTGPARVMLLEALADEDFEKEGLCVWSLIWQQGFCFGGPQ